MFTCLLSCTASGWVCICMEWRRSCSTCVQRAVTLLYLLRTRSTEPSSRTRSAEGRPAGGQRCMLCCSAAAFHAATPWNIACHNLRVVPWDGTKLQHKTLQNNVPHTGAVEPCGLSLSQVRDGACTTASVGDRAVVNRAPPPVRHRAAPPPEGFRCDVVHHAHMMQHG